MILIDLLQEIGIETKKVASTNGGEYHSPCPKCGGRDRFFTHPNRKMKNCIGSFCCRQCGISGDSIQFCRDFLDLSFQEAVERVQGTMPERGSCRFQSNATKIHRHAQLTSPSSKWLEKSETIVEEAYKQILLEPIVLEDLKQRGIPLEAVKQYKIGWNKADVWDDKSDWGIEGEEGKCVWLPKGIVIPTTEPNGKVLRLKIRRSEWQESDKFPKYVVISGCANGLNIIGDTNIDVMVVVESELDAYAIHHAIGDFAFVIAVGSNIKNPDNVTDYYAKNVSAILICHDNDDAGKKMFDKWQSLYKHVKAYPTPIGKDVGEYVKMGGDLKLFFDNILSTKIIKDEK